MASGALLYCISIDITKPYPCLRDEQGSSCRRFHLTLDNWKDCVWRAGELHGGSHHNYAVFYWRRHHGVRVC